MGISHLSLSPRGELIISRLIGAANAVFPGKARAEIPHRHIHYVVTQCRSPDRIIARLGTLDQVKVHTSVGNMSKIADLIFGKYGGELRDSKPAELRQAA
jgi:hypothetical protein